MRSLRDNKIKILIVMVFILSARRKISHELGFWSWIGKNANKEEKKGKSIDEVKNKLVRSLVEGDIYKNEDEH